MHENWTPRRRVTAAEIDAAKTPKGGWTYAQFAEWGVPTPPPKGWKERLLAFDDAEGFIATAAPNSLVEALDNPGARLIDGERFGVQGQLDVDPAKLLHKVVMAVINAGHADCLYEFPDVLAYFKARMPTLQSAVSAVTRQEMLTP